MKGVQWNKNHKNKSRTHSPPPPGGGESAEELWEDCLEHASAASPNSCLWCHLLQPRLLPLNGLPWSQSLALSDTIRSHQHSAHTGPAACNSPLHLPIFLTGSPAPEMTLHLSGGPFFSGDLLCKWGLWWTPPKRGPMKSQPADPRMSLGADRTQESRALLHP